MNFKQFHQEAKEWGVSTHFLESMRLAMIGSGERKAKLNPEHVTKEDMWFMANFGYILNLKTGEVKV